jgi:hypothetical protein
VIASHYTWPIDALLPASQVAIFLGVVCTVIAGFGGGLGDMVIGLLSMVVILVARNQQGSIDHHREEILLHILENIRGVLSQFNLQGKTTIYAACSVCHCTYALTKEIGSLKPVYPERCTNILRPREGQCNKVLLQPWDSSNTLYKLIKSFVYHHFHDYLAGLLSQLNIEKAMDETCDDFIAKIDNPLPPQSTSIFEADFLWSFYHDKGNQTLFLDRPQSEG